MPTVTYYLRISEEFMSVPEEEVSDNFNDVTHAEWLAHEGADKVRRAFHGDVELPDVGAIYLTYDDGQHIEVKSG